MTTGTRTGRRAALITAAALTAVGLVVAAGLAACTSDDPDETLPAETLTTTTTTTKPPTATDIAFQDAEDAYRRHIALRDEIGRHPGDKALVKQLIETSTGVEKAAEELKFRQWGSVGWHLKSGEVKVVWVKPKVAQLNLDPPQVKLTACNDATTALLLDKAGKPVRGDDVKTHSLNQITVVHDADGVWRVARVNNELVDPC
jgi:hypothetical protein